MTVMPASGFGLPSRAKGLDDGAASGARAPASASAPHDAQRAGARGHDAFGHTYMPPPTSVAVPGMTREALVNQSALLPIIALLTQSLTEQASVGLAPAGFGGVPAPNLPPGLQSVILSSMGALPNLLDLCAGTGPAVEDDDESLGPFVEVFGLHRREHGRRISAFNFFVKQTLPHVRDENPHMLHQECMKCVAQKWHGLTKDEKAKWCYDPPIPKVLKNKKNRKTRLPATQTAKPGASAASGGPCGSNSSTKGERQREVAAGCTRATKKPKLPESAGDAAQALPSLSQLFTNAACAAALQDCQQGAGGVSARAVSAGPVMSPLQLAQAACYNPAALPPSGSLAGSTAMPLSTGMARGIERGA